MIWRYHIHGHERLVEELASESECEVVRNKMVNVAFKALMCVNMKHKQNSIDPPIYLKLGVIDEHYEKRNFTQK